MVETIKIPHTTHLENQIAKARKARGWSQGDLARAANVSLRCVRAMESGSRFGNNASIAKVAKALGGDLNALYKIVD